MKKELVEHLKNGFGEKCLVCDNNLCGNWTDYNGQIKCSTCGTTYQILGCHLNEEFLKENNLKETDIAKRYCDCFEIIPLLKDYWNETKKSIPLGAYFGRSPIPQNEYYEFWGWVKLNSEKYKEKYKDYFNWENILK